MKQADEKSEMDARNPLEALAAVPPRDPGAAARGRAAFLAEAASLPAPVSPRAKGRLTGWWITRKEHTLMNAFLALFLALVLTLGGTSGVVYAAQDDLPNQPLYGVKLATEDLRLDLTGDPAARADLLLSFAGNRAQEMAALTEAGVVIPDSVAVRLNEEMDTALQLAAAGDDTLMRQILARVQTETETQLQAVNQMRANAPAQSQPVLDQLQTRLRDRDQLCQTGLADPQLLRDQMRDRDRTRDRTAVPSAGTDAAPGGVTSGTADQTCTPIGIGPGGPGGDNGMGTGEPGGGQNGSGNGRNQ